MADKDLEISLSAEQRAQTASPSNPSGFVDPATKDWPERQKS